MLRRMKEELNKHKARVEELEGQMSSQDTNNPLSSELNALRQQLAELRKVRLFALYYRAFAYLTCNSTPNRRLPIMKV